MSHECIMSAFPVATPETSCEPSPWNQSSVSSSSYPHHAAATFSKFVKGPYLLVPSRCFESSPVHQIYQCHCQLRKGPPTSHRDSFLCAWPCRKHTATFGSQTERQADCTAHGEPFRNRIPISCSFRETSMIHYLRCILDSACSHHLPCSRHTCLILFNDWANNFVQYSLSQSLEVSIVRLVSGKLEI